jgi:hypothetical protein
MKHATREDWLAAAVDLLRPLFEEAGYPIPQVVKVACGWPGGGSIHKRIGECWNAESSAGKWHEIFISPRLAQVLDSDGVLATLVHELAHAAVGTAAGHKGPFKLAVTALGLEGKATETHASADLIVKLDAIAGKLGEYPHAVLTPTAPKKSDKCRFLKMECDTCGCVIRTTRKWIDEYPETRWPCPCGEGCFVLEEQTDE